jgi:hypothetical protein
MVFLVHNPLIRKKGFALYCNPENCEKLGLLGARKVGIKEFMPQKSMSWSGERVEIAGRHA